MNNTNHVDSTRCIFVGMLTLTIISAWYVHRHWPRVPVPVMVLLMAWGVGVAMRQWSTTLRRYDTESLFDPVFFFEVVLPPVLYHTGYTLPISSFRGHVSGVLGLAFFGTLLSCILITCTVYSLAQPVGAYQMSILECALFASIVGATDPITITTLVHDTSSTYYALVMGESALNDVVSVVIYHLVVHHLEQPGSTPMWTTIGYFVWSFLGGGIIGGFMGVVSALTARLLRQRSESSRATRVVDDAHDDRVRHPTPDLKTNQTIFAVQLFIPWFGYTVCDMLGCSGIVGMLMCGIVSATPRALAEIDPNVRVACDISLGAMSQTAEIFIFGALGFALAMVDHASIGTASLRFALLALFATLAARAVHVFVIGGVVNLCRSRRERYDLRTMCILWVAGMRGSIAFALAITVGRTVHNDYVVYVILIATALITVVTSIGGGLLLPCIIPCQHPLPLVL